MNILKFGITNLKQSVSQVDSGVLMLAWGVIYNWENAFRNSGGVNFNSENVTGACVCLGTRSEQCIDVIGGMHSHENTTTDNMSVFSVHIEAIGTKNFQYQLSKLIIKVCCVVIREKVIPNVLMCSSR